MMGERFKGLKSRIGVFLKDRRGLSNILYAIGALGAAAAAIAIALHFKGKAQSIGNTAETKINSQINSA